ncbi:helix-turn-helix domain-containing protein [Microbispora sp. CA-102843]|uniref:helix-turn-helix domain-containing protein n=1 Tax=Microbispora sp. CA-102843 TaxID=3239952 RepID=UPI003D8BD345
MLMTAASSTKRLLPEEGRRALESRAEQLRLTWDAVADRAGMSVAHLRRIRKGETPITSQMAAGLEEALKLQPGSIDALLAGGAITPLPEARKSLAQLLVERGIVTPDEVTLSDEVVDPEISAIMEMDELSEEAKDNFLRAYQLMRRSILSVRETKKPRG